MPTREEELRDQTYQHLDSVGARVYHTLTDVDSKKVERHRVAKALGLTIEALCAKDLMSEEEVDELLLDLLG